MRRRGVFVENVKKKNKFVDDRFTFVFGNVEFDGDMTTQRDE